MRDGGVEEDFARRALNTRTPEERAAATAYQQIQFQQGLHRALLSTILRTLPLAWGVLTHNLWVLANQTPRPGHLTMPACGPQLGLGQGQAVRSRKIG